MTIAFASVAVLAAITSARTTAQAATDSTATGSATSKATVMVTTIPDFQGAWRLDKSASDAPPKREGNGSGGWRRGRGPGGGGAGAPPPGGPEGGRRPGASGRRPVPLPDLMHVTHTETMVSFEDSAGTVIQEITTAPEADTLLHVPGALLLHGTWKDQALEVQRSGARGTVRQAYAIEDGGRSLVVRTTVSPADGESRTFKRVYRRVDS
jgi:hypothetical protein